MLAADEGEESDAPTYGRSRLGPEKGFPERVRCAQAYLIGKHGLR